MKKIAAIALATITAATIFAGCGPAKENPNNAIVDPMPIEEEGEMMINEELGEPMAKVMVNISGEVTEISQDGTKIKVGDMWVIIDENTIFEDDPDNGVEAVSKEFKVGNSVAGFTEDDTTQGEVTAYQIYSNMQ